MLLRGLSGVRALCTFGRARCASRLRFLAALALFLHFCGAPFDARHAYGGEPEVRVVVAEGSAAVSKGPAPGIVSPSGAGSAPQGSAPPEQLRHLPAASSGWRMNGEIGTLEWPVYLLPGETAGMRRFRVAYRSSASVLPDASFLTLTVNDKVVGRSAISSPAQIKPIDFEIAPALLSHGFNSIRISVEQQHRVDCSLEATYELWTEVLPEKSGFLPGAEAETSSIDVGDLAALRPRADGSLPIEVLFAGRLKPQRVENILLTAQAIALAGRFQFPIVQFSPENDASVGVRLVVGTAAEVASLFDPSERKLQIAGPLVRLLARPGARPTLVVSGETEDNLAIAIEQLIGSTKADPVGTAPGLRAAGNVQGLRLSGGERVRLADLGFSSIEFVGRFFRLAIDVAMPFDFLSADYGKLTVDLAGGYAGGLNPNAQIRIEVNGRNGASVALANGSGGVFRHNEIFVPLGLLKAGRNRIEILAQLENAADTACDAMVRAGREGSRFLLLDSSEIRFPAIARVGQQPDLRATMSGGFPYASSPRPSLHVPVPDRAAMAAALTLAVHTGVAARAIVRFAFAPSLPSATGDALIVAPVQALDPALMTPIGLDPDAVRNAWESRAVAAGPSASPAHPKRPALNDNQAQDEISRIPAQGEIAPARGAGNLAQRWAARFSSGSDWAQFFAGVADRASRAVAAVAAPIRTIVFNGREDTPAIDAGAASIFAQGFRSGDDNGVVTIATARDSESLWRAVRLMVHPARSGEARGRLSILDDAGDLVQAVNPARIRFVRTQPLGLENVRLLAAGWLSLNSFAYVALALVLASLLALATFSLARNVGRSSK